eukprot:TsM_000083600 transcript=TsM_000083600 gene=TsM_000083600
MKRPILSAQSRFAVLVLRRLRPPAAALGAPSKSAPVMQQSLTSNRQIDTQTTTINGIQRRLRQIHQQSRILKVGGTVCLVLSVVAFITGATLMILDFDGNDDEYYMEDGIVKTRMGMFDYGVIVIGVAVVLTVFSAIFWGLLCFLPASSMASLQAVIAASASTVGLQR